MSDLEMDDLVDTKLCVKSWNYNTNRNNMSENSVIKVD